MAKRKNQKRSNKKYQVNNRRVRANHQYKDTVFRMLYRSFPNKRILETIHETPACVKGITIEYYIF